jgi:hypothetical protein
VTLLLLELSADPGGTVVSFEPPVEVELGPVEADVVDPVGTDVVSGLTALLK